MITVQATPTLQVRYDPRAGDNTAMLAQDYITMRRGKRTRCIWSWSGTTKAAGVYCINYHAHYVTTRSGVERCESWKVQVQLESVEIDIAVHQVRSMGRLG